MKNRTNEPRTKMQVLIIEDDDKKYKLVKKKFNELNDRRDDLECSLTRAKNCFDGISAYDQNFFDLIILDLKIPLGSGRNSDCDVRYSKEFYEHVIFGERDLPFLIVGLTSVEESEYAEVFDENPIFNIENFSVASDEWFRNIESRINFVCSAKRAVKNLHSKNYDLDLLIVTAREKNEYEPLIEAMGWLDGSLWSDAHLEDRLHRFGMVKFDEAGIFSVGVVCLGEMGLSVSAAVCAQLVNIHRPKYFAMLGMCCGFKDDEKHMTKLGDVIIASQTANWDEGMYQVDNKAAQRDPFFINETKIRNPPNDFAGKVEKVLEGQWKSIEKEINDYYHLPQSRAVTADLDNFDKEASLHFGLLLSGSSVINSVDKVTEIRKRFSTAYGLEMEAHSIYSAMHCISGAKPRTLVVKGVADHGDGTKTKQVQKIATVASYIVFKRIITKMGLQ
ncbi:MAG: hypothetical protein JJU08_19300 [Rhodobacteraceae bacterium]|nr:hypothetical protein [Paracoccaceae bacterium]